MEANCQECGEPLDQAPNVEAFEVFDKLVCDHCAESLFIESIEKENG